MSKNVSTTVLSAAARLVGDLATDEDVVLSGTFEGTLRTSRTLQISPTGLLRGEAHAESITVLGRVFGPLYAVDRIQLQAGASVDGDISAQRVRIGDDAVFNGRCSITGPQASRRQYLVPAVLQTFGATPSPQALTAVQDAAEGLLRDFGFDLEVRPGNNGHQTLRPIFRSREPLAYAQLREQFRSIEQVLQEATRTDGAQRPAASGMAGGEPLQTTGRDGARALFHALEQLRNGALMLGPVIVTRVEEDRGPRLSVRVRQDAMPAEAAADVTAPDPSALLMAFQKAQSEVAQDLSNTHAGRTGVR
jgi:cytoskeletal protein CcmA (bactofilin family)